MSDANRHVADTLINRLRLWRGRVHMILQASGYPVALNDRNK